MVLVPLFTGKVRARIASVTLLRKKLSSRDGNGYACPHAKDLGSRRGARFDMAKRKFARLGIAIAATAACLAGSQAGRAQQSDDVTVEISRCVDLESPEERRACYGAEVDAAVRERERSAATAAPAAPPAQERRPPDREDAAARPQRAKRDGSEGQPTLVAKIAALRETVPNTYLITLDNDEVWRQTRPKWHPLRVGQEVKIYPTSWGNSFRLFVDGLSGYIQVERAR